MRVTQKQIAAAADRHESTICRHIKQLIESGKFKKITFGKQFNEDEVKELERLLGFKYK